MDRVYNVEKSRKRKTSESSEETPRKRGRPKRVSSLVSRYPSIQIDDDDDSVQQQQHVRAKWNRKKPRKEILLPLMKSTFNSRR